MIILIFYFYLELHIRRCRCLVKHGFPPYILIKLRCVYIYICIVCIVRKIMCTFYNSGNYTDNRIPSGIILIVIFSDKSFVVHQYVQQGNRFLFSIFFLTLLDMPDMYFLTGEDDSSEFKFDRSLFFFKSCHVWIH